MIIQSTSFIINTVHGDVAVASLHGRVRASKERRVAAGLINGNEQFRIFRGEAEPD